jgi:diguanylate cyclase (GGDEF)-like protein/PAS domain S-box-containing protein
MMQRHPLLHQQLKLCMDAEGRLDTEKLARLVESAYVDMDRERSRARRTLTIMAEEIEELTTDLQRRIDERTEETNVLRGRFTGALDSITQGILLVASDGMIVNANLIALELLEISASDIAAGLTFGGLMRRLYDRGEFATASQEQAEIWLRLSIAEQPGRYVRVRPDGRHIEIRTTQLADGSCIRTYDDVTERHQREQALIAAEQEYRTLFDNSVVGIYRSTLDGRQLRANPALVRLNGYASEAHQLASVTDIGKEWYVDPNRRDEFKRKVLANGRIDDFVSEIYRQGTQTKVWVSETAWTVRDPDGRPVCFEGMVSDATARVESERRILELSLNDPLTGLKNRRAFLEELRLALKNARRRPCTVGVLCLDLDRFKFVNDTMGHPAGDVLLRKVARRIRQAVGRDHIVARLGGDEFAVLVSRCDGTTLAKLGAAILTAISRQYDVRGQRCIIGGSVGMADSDGRRADADELMKMADIALYVAKSNGKGQAIPFAESMRAASERRQKLENHLRNALSNGELHLEYQPIVDARCGAVKTHEALMRWESPELGPVPPGEFIPVAEESGLLHVVGQWLLRTACTDAAQRLEPRAVAVNVSAVQLRSPHFKSFVLNALAASGLPPEALELEITENALLANDQVTLDVLTDLKAMGVKVALDDFGTGYASLNYLQNFTFDKIKIDRSFVVNSNSNPASMSIIRLTVALGQDLGVQIVAEGIETEAERVRLIAAGCHLQQGFLLGRPARLPTVIATQEPAGSLRHIGNPRPGKTAAVSHRARRAS